MPKGRPRGESDLGRPALRTRGISFAYSVPPSPSTSNGSLLEKFSFDGIPGEILIAILLPLPYLVSSLLGSPEIRTNHAKYATNLEAAEGILEEVASTALPVPTKSASLIEACALTSGTLLLVGILGRLYLTPTPLDRRKDRVSMAKDTGANVKSFLSLGTARRIVASVAKVGLPFLATVEIGGMRTGMILLSAAAGGLLTSGVGASDLAPVKPWKRAIKSLRWTCALFMMCLLCDVFWLRKDEDPASLVRGYIALGKASLFLQLPFPTQSLPSTRSTISRQSSFGGTALSPTNTWTTHAAGLRLPKQRYNSPLIGTREDTNITIIAGSVLALLTVVFSILLATTSRVGLTTILIAISSIAAAAASLLITNPSRLRSRLKLGFALGISFAALFGVWFDSCSPSSTAATVGVAVLSYAAIRMDTHVPPELKSPTTNTRVAHSDHADIKASRFTRFLLNHTEDWPLLHGIFLGKESRRIVYFMLVNFLFMFIQTFYALLSGSLGLLSDSIHMFFDCVGLLAGLIAAVMSKWPPNARFPYGYGKVETLSGLGNGIFLIIISVEIMWESLERFLEGAELRRVPELLLVSVGGLVVNLIGLMFIGHHHHGHGHDHGHNHDHDHDHSHAHANGHSHGNGHAHHLHDGDHAHEHHESHKPGSDTPSLAAGLLSNPPAPQHHHHHGNENMAGIYLHILADTMGSVAVIVSALLISYTGWSGWDPIASFIIAVLIILAACPLVIGSARRLLLTVPGEMEYTLRSGLQELSGLRGVEGYAVPRFWMNDIESAMENGHSHQEHDHSHHDHSHESEKQAENCTADHQDMHPHDPHHSHHHDHDHFSMPKHSHNYDAKPTAPLCMKILGVIHIIATPNADLEDVRSRVNAFFIERNMDVLVHVERGGTLSSSCWCGGVAGQLASPSPFSPAPGVGVSTMEEKLSKIFAM